MVTYSKPRNLLAHTANTHAQIRRGPCCAEARPVWGRLCYSYGSEALVLDTAVPTSTVPIHSGLHLLFTHFLQLPQLSPGKWHLEVLVQMLTDAESSHHFQVGNCVYIDKAQAYAEKDSCVHVLNTTPRCLFPSFSYSTIEENRSMKSCMYSCRSIAIYF